MNQTNIYRGRFSKKVFALLFLAIFFSGCNKMFRGNALVAVVPSVLTFNVNGQTEFVSANVTFYLVGDPDATDEQRARAKKNAIDDVAKLDFMVTGPKTSTMVSGVRASSAETFGKFGIAVTPLVGAEKLAVSFINGQSIDPTMVTAITINVVMETNGKSTQEYTVTAIPKSGYGRITDATMRFIIKPSGTVGAFASNVANFHSIDTLRDLNQGHLKGEQPNAKLVLAKSAAGLIEGALTSTVGKVTKNSFNEGRLVLSSLADSVTKTTVGQKLMALGATRQASGLADSSIPYVQGSDRFLIAFSANSETLRTRTVKDPMDGLYVEFSGWNIDQSKTAATAILMGSAKVLKSADDNGDGGSSLNNLFRQLEPAVAVRGSGCVACHADVQGAFVIDFGHGMPYAFGSPSPFSLQIYGNHADNWATAKLTTLSSAGIKQQGKVYVPRTPAAALGYESLAAYLRSVLTEPEVGIAAPAVIEKTVVQIGAPTTAQILEVAREFPPATPNLKYISPFGGSLSGIVLDLTGKYFRNSGIVECYGDVIIKGVLFLKDLAIRTDDNGCRFYVTGSAFVQKKFTYFAKGSNVPSDEPIARQNIQITSATGVFLGLSQDTMVSRHGPAPGTIGRDSFHTVEPGLTTAEKNDRIIAEAALISDLVDGGGKDGDPVNYSGLLVNAPYVESRYPGLFKGVVICEVALFVLEKFAFIYDNRFHEETMPILPLFSEAVLKQILYLSDDGIVDPPPTPTPTPTGTISVDPTITPIVEPTFTMTPAPTGSSTPAPIGSPTPVPTDMVTLEPTPA